MLVVRTALCGLVAGGTMLFAADGFRHVSRRRDVVDQRCPVPQMRAIYTADVRNTVQDRQAGRVPTSRSRAFVQQDDGHRHGRTDIAAFASAFRYASPPRCSEYHDRLEEHYAKGSTYIYKLRSDPAWNSPHQHGVCVLPRMPCSAHAQ